MFLIHYCTFIFVFTGFVDTSVLVFFLLHFHRLGVNIERSVKFANFLRFVRGITASGLVSSVLGGARRQMAPAVGRTRLNRLGKRLITIIFFGFSLSFK